MALMVSELYDALKDAGAHEEQARKAAEAVAAYDQRFAELRMDISLVRSEVQSLKSRVDFTLAICLLTLGGVMGVLWKIATA